MSIPFIDLKAQQKKIRSEIDQAIQNVLDHGQYILGPEVHELQEKLADFVGVKHCLGVASGTDALLIALMALGIKPGDEVITTPFTFIATGETIALLGAKPVFVDVDERTYNINPQLIEQAITSKTKAIMPVSLYGQCCDFDIINAIAEKHNLPVIEDGAQSFGATYKGKRSCSLTTIGCTSFFPSKPLGCYGDGGACFTNDSELAEKMRQISVHGQDRRYHHSVIGVNGRLDTIQAAILLQKLSIYPEEVERRAEIGRLYSELLNDNEKIVTPYLAPENVSVFAQYTLLVENREAVQEKLKEQGIPTAIHYPMPLHKQPCFQFTESFPVAERVSKRVMSLPMHPYLDSNSQNTIVEALNKACLD